jgi:hypothetical protein
MAEAFGLPLHGPPTSAIQAFGVLRNKLRTEHGWFMQSSCPLSDRLLM